MNNQIQALAAALLLDACMAPLLVDGGLQAAVDTFEPEHRDEAERLLLARVGVVQLLTGTGPHEGLWQIQAAGEGDDDHVEMESTADHLEAIMRAASNLGQVSVLDSAIVTKHLQAIAAVDVEHPLVQHWRLLREACTPMGVEPPAWPEIEALNIPPPTSEELVGEVKPLVFGEVIGAD